MPRQNPDEVLAEDMARFYADPLGWVMYAYTWGEGELRGFKGPLAWQAEYLNDLGDQVKRQKFNGVDAAPVIQMATASGHGIGKTALVAWIVGWNMSVAPLAKGIVTANTSPQLESKTWAEIAKWNRRSIVGDWFSVRSGRGSMAIQHKHYPDAWRCDAQTCREENSESFAGNHSASSRPFFIFDEGSNIPEKIYEVAMGGLTDGAPQFLMFGNPTRNSGYFFQAFHRMKHRWIRRQIDSRDVELTNKELFKEWEDDFGDDSDFFRVRVRGVFPRASTMQFIPLDIVQMARTRQHQYLKDDPLILGIDIARGGDDNTVLQWRRGMCARALPGAIPAPSVFPGETVRDSTKTVSYVMEAIKGWKPEAVFLDGTGVGGPLADRLRQLNLNVIEIGFGNKSPDPHCANMRAYMWQRMKEWLFREPQLDDDDDLEEELIGPEFGHNRRDQLVLEAKEHMKDRGLASPDRGDALALTFAHPVLPRDFTAPVSQQTDQDYDPMVNF